jgi:hypothetical protein
VGIGGEGITGDGIVPGDDGGPGDDGTDDGGGDDGGEDGPGEDDGDDVRFDVGADGTGGPGDEDCDPETDPECACTSVDLLFVIDNSGSMEPCQIALGEAFPNFAQAIVNELPVATSLHVGVTSTEMGHATMGWNHECEGGAGLSDPADPYYITPDVEDTGTNGAQGRLYEAEGKYYYEIDTDAPQSEIDALSEWFAAAAHIGTGGSQVEMSAGPAGWAFHGANDSTNAGFLRDEGSVLVLFFLQDEPDQTPDGAAQSIVDMISAAKAGCGGMDCAVGGGAVDVECLPEVALGVLLDSFGAPAVVQTLPGCETVTPEYFEGVLVETLAQVIAQKCGEIPPAPP